MTWWGLLAEVTGALVLGGALVACFWPSRTPDTPPEQCHHVRVLPGAEPYDWEADDA